MALRWLVLTALALGGCDHHDEVQGAPSATVVLPPLPPLPPLESTQEPAPPASARGGDAGAACGRKGLPDCPLQGWMKANMNPPMKSSDWQGIAEALEHAAKLAPPDYAKSGYTNWVSISEDGANAARAAELNAVKAACRGCHDQYKNKYRAEMRARPLP